jgi:hypothetical protein
MPDDPKIREGKQTALRLGARHDAMLEAVATELRMSKTEVMRVSLEDKYRRTFGRRSADLAPVTLATPRTPKG